jgi:mono/diheme cytochrome c family protein
MAVRSTFLIPVMITVLVVACASGNSPADAPPGAQKVDRAAKLYGTHCTLCHGKDGTLGISGAKDLSISILTKEEMIALVTNGKGAMAAYKNVLSKAEIEAVVDHVRTLHTTE